MDLKDRKNFLGASDTPIVMGVSPWRTRYQLWQEKLGLKEFNFSNFATDRGNAMEPIARAFYNNLKGVQVEPQKVMHPEIYFLGANLDGISKDGKLVVEIKCPGQEDHAIAAKGEVPEKYYWQCQKQLLVTGLLKMDYLSYVSDTDYYIIEVERNEADIEKIIKEETIFWKDHVEAFFPPALSDRDYKENKSDEWAIASARYTALRDKRKSAEMEEEEAKQELIKLCGDHPTKGAGLKLQRITRKGAIDTKAIAHTYNVDLERYRKKPITMWKIIDE